MELPKFLVISSDACPWCDKVKALLTERGLTYAEINLMEVPELGAVMSKLGVRTVPQVFQLVGGYEDAAKELGQ